MPEGSDGAPAPVNDNNPGGDIHAGAEHPRGARRDRGNRNRRGHHNVTRVEKFTGKCDDLKNYVYEISSSHRTTETFMRTTHEIAEYIGREFDDAGDFRTGLVEMSLPALREPEDPAEPDNRAWKGPARPASISSMMTPSMLIAKPEVAAGVEVAAPAGAVDVLCLL